MDDPTLGQGGGLRAWTTGYVRSKKTPVERSWSSGSRTRRRVIPIGHRGNRSPKTPSSNHPYGYRHPPRKDISRYEDESRRRARATCEDPVSLRSDSTGSLERDPCLRPDTDLESGPLLTDT